MRPRPAEAEAVAALILAQPGGRQWLMEWKVAGAKMAEESSESTPC